MNVPLYIAKRYAFSKSKTKAINTITKISTLGILVSAMALFVVMSVFSGLKTFNLSFTNAIDPELVMLPKTGKSITISSQQLKQLQQTKEIANFSFVVEERVVFSYGEKQLAAHIKGVDSLYKNVTNIKKHLAYGEWLIPHSNQVILGNVIASNLSLGMFSNDKFLEVLAMKPGEGSFNSPDEAYNRIALNPVGIYALNNVDIDSKYIYSDVSLAQNLLDWKPNQYSKIEFKISGNSTENSAIKSIEKIFGENFVLKNRSQLNDSLFKMLQTESLAIYLIFTLVIIVTLFSLAGALIMMILEKKEHLKTLNDIGIEIKQIKRIFLFQGMILSTIGAVLGIFLGFIIVFIQFKFELITISDQLPYPVELNFSNAITVFLTIFVLAFLASFLASTRVTKDYLSSK